jgi:uncharacterized protein (TIGR04255 family)
MPERPANLSNYSNPPIDELAIAVQFPPIDGMHDAHIGLYWQLVREQYPRAESQPRIESPIEVPGGPQIQPSVIQFPVSIPTQGRTWLINGSDDYIIQIQNNRFVQNWRRRQAEYPHFEEVWSLFNDNYRKFRELLISEKLPVPNVQQVEITYINWIPDMPAARFLKAARAAEISAYGRTYEPENQTLISRYGLNDDPVERLYIQCQPAIRATEPNVEGSQFALIYRGARAEGLAEGELDSLANSGHVIVVDAFTKLTTDEAQQAWGRYQ